MPVPKFDSKGKKTGKVRPLVLAPVESRIVQRAILNVLVEIPGVKPFVKTPYSFGGIRSDKAKHLPDGGKIPRAERASAVPAAIKAVLDSIGEGARFVACADIEAFFTRIPKSKVTAIVQHATGDSAFTSFFEDAIAVELENIDNIRRSGGDWPIEDIGVAQGNSLSPLLGNMILAAFDKEMNKGDCRCIRYIDDFIILAPTLKAATARLRRAEGLLKDLGMKMSPEKSSKAGCSINDGFDFLGINFCPGAIRPGQKAQAKFLTSVETLFDNGRRSLIAVQEGKFSERTHTLLGTLRRLDGMIDGWGKHYWFCNDEQIWRNIDAKVSESIGRFIGLYADVRDNSVKDRRQGLLGVAELVRLEREPFAYPSV
ncbi:MAG: reverse transcriptase domain-containing protein [Sulfuritalea sp.]|nr:reverse transcriptase domain-containing protein [Sulfuritalea sp.]